MRDADVGAFYALLDDVGTLLLRPGQVLTATAKAMFFRALAEHDLASVRAALDAHVKDPQRGRFMPLPADLIAQLQAAAADDGRPGAEEAWSIALAARDESDTVVWTDEAAQAWAAALPVLKVGDEVGARMAFREAYARLVARARTERMPVAWSASLGFDAERRQIALDAAVRLGRLPRADAYQLSAPVSAPLLAWGQALGAPPHVIESLRALADRMRSGEDDAPSRDALARAQTQQLKAASAERVQQYCRAEAA